MKLVQSITIDTKNKFQSTKLGGFSGLVIKGKDFYVVSDDRGRFGESRIYRLELSVPMEKSSAGIFKLDVKEKISLLKKNKKLPVFDLEALAPFDGGWILSSEGDLNAKPKIWPEIFFVKNKEIKQKIDLPEDFIPKFNGQQVRGLYNNKAFEGLYFDERSRRLLMVSESGLVQKKDGDLVFYILEYTEKNGEFSYDKMSQLDFNGKIEGSFLYNGASELTQVSENTLLLLTRSVQASLSLQYTNIVWLIKRRSVKDSWEIKDKYIINPENANEELNQNYEGMSLLEWNGRRYLVLVSDDNFNSFEKTVFSFFDFEVK